MGNTPGRLTAALLLLLTFSAPIHAQLKGQAYVDSLLGRLASMPDDSTKLQAYFLLDSTYGTLNPDKEVYYSRLRLQLAQKLAQPRWLVVSLISVTHAYCIKGELDSGIRYGLMADSVARGIGDKKHEAVALVNVGVCYEAQSKHIPALDVWLRSLSIAEMIHDSSLFPVLDQNIALIYYDQKNYPKAQSYLDQGLPIIQRRHNDLATAGFLEMIANNEVRLGNPDKAHAALRQSLELHRQAQDSLGMAKVYTMFTGTFDNTRRSYDSMLYYGYKARAIWDRIDPNNYVAVATESNIAVSLFNMANDSINNPISAAERRRLMLQSEAGLSRAVERIRQNHHMDEAVEVYDELQHVRIALHDYKGAYEALLANKELSDSLYSQENKNKLASLDEEHEVSLRDKQLQINAIALANQRRQRWFFIGGIALLLIIGILLYYQSQTRKRTNTVLLQLNNQLDEANEIKTRFFSILNHDLRTPVANLINFLHLQQEDPHLLDEEERAVHTQQVRTNAERLLETMEDLLLWSKGQMKNFQPHLQPVDVTDLFTGLRNYFSGVPNISFQFDTPPSMQVQTDEHYLKTIMRNLTGNAVRALAGTPNPTIIWKAWQENGQSYLSITDNGPGATDQQLKALYDDSIPVGIKTGLGLHVVRDLARAISCRISVHSLPGQGTEFRLLIA